MKNFILFCITAMLFSAISGMAQTYPSIDMARELPANTALSGTVCNTNNYYFKTKLPANGTFTLAVDGTNPGPVGNGYIYVYIYDARKLSGLLSAGYIGSSSIKPDSSTSDTLRVYGLTADSVFVRVTSSRCFNFNISYTMEKVPPTDMEPNNTIEDATFFNMPETKTGNINYVKAGVGDANDYYYTVLPDNGTLNINVSGTNRGNAAGYMYMYVYDRRKLSGTISAIYIDNNSSVAPGEEVNGTLTLKARAKDTVYFRLTASQPFAYELGYTLTDIPVSDPETNDDFDSALPLASAQIREGIIGYYKNGTADQSDFYATKLPADGAVKLYITAKNMDSRTGYVYVYGYDKRRSGGQLFAVYAGNTSSIAPGAEITDTITVFGQLVDSFYFRVTSIGGFTYSISYEISQDAQSEDQEPNNTFEDANDLAAGIAGIGRIGYSSGGVTDASDYFKAQLPAIGTLRVIVEGTNKGNANGYMYLYMYDKRAASGTLGAEYVLSSAVAPEATVRDTFYVYNRMNELHYLRMTSIQPFNYTIQYDVINAPPVDVEPNNDIASAILLPPNQVLEGNIGYFASGVADQSDFYQLELARNSTLKVVISGINNGNASGYIYAYVYDNRGLSGTITADYIQGSNIAPGSPVNDTLIIKGRASGTYYVRLTSIQGFKYSVQYLSEDLGPQDPESNNTIATSSPVPYNTLAEGNIGYEQGGLSDQNDYFAAALPAYGTLRIIVRGTNMSAGNGYMYHYAYDGRKLGGQMFAGYIKGSSNPSGTTVSDTVYVSCRAIDSFYYRMTSFGAWQYEWQYDLIENSSPEDSSNNTFAEATPLPVNTTAIDNIGYLSAGVSDANDYFVTGVPSNGTIGYIIKARNTSAGNAYMYGYIYEKRNSNVSVSAGYLGGSSSFPAGTYFEDTLRFNCASFDTLYFRMTATGCWSYEVTPYFIDRQPVVTAAYERMGNELGFRAEQVNTQRYNWQFSNNISSTRPLPLLVFSPGSYTARLIGQNEVCPQFTDTSALAFDVFGVEYFTPEKSAAGGDAAMTIYGGGLDSNVEVSLSRNGQVIRPRALHGNSLKNVLTAEIDLHFAEEGVYDVTITIPGIDTLIYPNGFTVTSFVYPTTTARVIAPGLWRTNQFRTLELSVENHGTVTASGVRVGIAWPRSIEVEWPETLQPPREGIDSVPDGSGGYYTVPRSALHFIYDSVDTNIPITNLQGEPFDGFIRYFWVPHVPANASIEFPFKAKAPASGVHTFTTFTMSPNLFGSCGTEANGAAEDLMQAELLDYADEFADKTKVPLFKGFVKTAKVGRKHMGSAASYYGKKFWAWKDGYEFDGDAALADLIQETEANNKYALETLAKETAGFVGNKALGSANQAIQSRVKNINGTLARNPNLSPERFDKFIDILNSTNDQSKRLDILDKMFTGVKALDKANGRAEALKKIAEDCPELKPQLEDLIKEAENEHNHRNTERKRTETRTSFDPNDIYGPVGFNTNRYVNGTDVQHFIVAFENVDTAKADAQVVIIKDTLDKNVFDVTTFEFGSITIGDRYYRIPSDRNELVLHRNINDSIDVRINAGIDTATGVITWVFTALDRNTGGLPDFAGFLPPNQNKPEGEGSVQYKIKPLPGLPHLTAMRSKALIFFDDNEPIATSTWQNIIDLEGPVSQLSASRVNDTTIRVQLNGNDAHAGYGLYSIYVKENSKDWVLLSKQYADSMIFEGFLDSTYSFYVVGVDSLRNEEFKAPSAEAVITLNNPLPVTYTSFTGRPLMAGNELQWTTATEANNQGFTIEVSTDGTTFKEAGFVASKAINGNSNLPLQYGFLHPQPAATQYYRLRQTDFDGSVQYSNVIRIDRDQTATIRIIPNPVVNSFTLSSQGSANVESIRLMDMQGRVIQTFAPNANGPYRLQNVPRGMYLLQLMIDGQMQTERLSVIR